MRIGIPRGREVGFALGLTMLLVGIFFVDWRLFREPEFHGKSVMRWLEDLKEARMGRGRFADAEHAFGEFGPQAIPFLFASLRQKDSKLNDLYRAFHARCPARIQKVLPQLPPKWAIAGRMRRLQWDVGDALSSLGPTAVRPLMAGLQDRSKQVRAAAAFALGAYGRQAFPAVPDLLATAADPDPDVHLSAVISLRILGKEASHAGLRTLEPGKPKVVAILTELIVAPTDDFNRTEIKAAAREALKKIDPATAAALEKNRPMK